MDINSIIEELMNKKPHLIDIFPRKVPQKSDNRYFGVERYFQRNRADIDRRFTAVILKLLCYYDMTLETEDGLAEDPAAEELSALLEKCFRGGTGFVNILLNECEALIMLNSDDLYMTVYNAEGEAAELISQLARSEGLFYYEASEN